MVTAETAMVLPVLFLVALLACWLLLAGVTELRCADLAEVAARALARGDSPAAVLASVQRAAPGARVEVSSDSESVTVVVRWAVPKPGGFAVFLPVLTASGSAMAAVGR